MSKHSNIRHELRNEVFAAFDDGVSKKGVKGQDEDLAQTKVFSYKQKFQLLDRINDFCKTLPSNIRHADQLTPEHVRSYLDGKVAAGCTQNTIDEYRSELKKLGIVCGIDLACSRVEASKARAADRGASAVISREDFSKILSYAEEHPSSSGLCLQLEALIGVRVGDLAYGLKVNSFANRLEIMSKNGKLCYRPITPPIARILNSEPFKKLYYDGKFHSPKPNSLNKYLARTQDKLGLERHSFHDVRRRIAQDKYDELRGSGVSRPDALSAVSLWLNHGASREEMLLASYIADAW